MIDERERYERAFELFEMPEPAFERLERRRDRRRRNRRIAAGAVGLAIAVLVLGGLARELTLDRSRPADEIPTPAPVEEPTRIATAQPLPDEPGEWTFETSLGTWTWTRIDGDRRTLPGSTPFFADGVYWAFDHGLWSSADGITWTREPMPEAFGGRQPWARTDDGGPVWAFTGDGSLFVHEGGSWRAVDVPPASVPSVPGMSWGPSESFLPPRVVQLVTQGDRTLALRPINGEIDWQAVYGKRASVWLAEPHDSGELVVIRGYEVSGSDGEQIARLEMQVVPGDPGAVEFRDVATDDVVLRIEATDPRVAIEEIAGGYSSPRPAITELLVDDGTGFRQVQAPWSGMSIESVDIASGTGGFVAVGVDTPEWYERGVAPDVFVWRSQDGIAWEQLQSPSFGADLAEIGLAGNGERLVLAAIGTSPDAARPVVLWSSIDGATWQPAAELGNTEFDPESLTTGGHSGAAFVALPWMMSGTQEVVQPVLSPDGATWIAIAQGPDIEDGLCRTGGGYGGGQAVGDAVFVTSGCDETGHRILWVGRLMTPAAES